MAGDGDLTLQTMIGPYGGWFHLTDPDRATIGRAVDCDVCLLHETVARQHATLMRHGASWFIVDHGGTSGTFVNGVRLEPTTPTPIANADLLRIGPWTFRVLVGAPPTMAPSLDEPLTPQPAQGGQVPRATFRLRLLSECLGKLGSASGEEEMAEIALETAIEGSGYRRGLMLRPLESPDPAQQDVTVVAAVRTGPLTERERRLGRAILQAAWDSAKSGRARAVSPASVGLPSDSEAGAESLLCAPVVLGNTLISFLFLDARGGEQNVLPDAADFAEAVACAYGLALANVRRHELDRRQQALAAELHAAREAQQFILPPARGELGFVRYAMQMTPGLFVAGDLFDVVPLHDGRVAFFIGDVAGHGAGSGMVMATTQSHLHAELRDGRGAAAAVGAVNEYLASRTLGGRFVSLWVGIFSPDGTVEYVDAGHGHWLRLPETTPAEEADIPLGIDPARTFSSRTLKLTPGSRIVAFSDGLIEQRRTAGATGSSEFGLERFRDAIAMSATCDEDVRRAFAAVTSFAGTPTLADDATAASIEYLGPA